MIIVMIMIVVVTILRKFPNDLSWSLSWSWLWLWLASVRIPKIKIWIFVNMLENFFWWLEITCDHLKWRFQSSFTKTYFRFCRKNSIFVSCPLSQSWYICHCLWHTDCCFKLWVENKHSKNKLNLILLNYLWLSKMTILPLKVQQSPPFW